MARNRTQDKNNKKVGSGHKASMNSALIRDFEAQNTYVPARQSQPLEPKNETQAVLMNAIGTKDLVFATGPAGTGKTYIAVAMACEALKAKRIDKIILTRPAVEAAGEQLGFLPGELDEKYAPYIEPVRQIMQQRLGAGFLSYALKNEQIQPLPLAFMRGRTFDNAWVILDEAQNTTPEQMKMLLTRVGQNCKVLVCGDLDQSDISGVSGLGDAVQKTQWMDEAAEVEFAIDDCVRSGFAKSVLKSYSNKRDSAIEAEGREVFMPGDFEIMIKQEEKPKFGWARLFPNLR